MLNGGHHFIRYVLAFMSVPISFAIAAEGFGIHYFFSFILSIGMFFITYFGIQSWQKRRACQKFSLTKSEYRHIEEQLKEAQRTLSNLSRLYMRIRTISGFKQLFEMNRLAKRIIAIVKANPQKFYQAEQFFYAHLPSSVELTEKYALLSRQPIKDTDVHISLQQTRETLTKLNAIMQDDLQKVLAADIEALKMELDFAKMKTAQHARQKEQSFNKGDLKE